MLVTELCYNMFNPSTLNLFDPKFLIVQVYYSIQLNAAARIDTRKWVLWQTVKTQMKCRRTRHFIRICTVCKDKTDLQRNYFNITCICI